MLLFIALLGWLLAAIFFGLWLIERNLHEEHHFSNEEAEELWQIREQRQAKGQP